MINKISQWITNLWMPKKITALSVMPVTEHMVPSDGSTKTKMYLNDPTTPDLIIEQEIPKTLLSINAMGDQGGGFPFGSIQQQASACKGIVGSALAFMASKTPRTINRWAATNSLAIMPRAGKDINAFYDRGALKFFFFGDKVMQKNIYACDSRTVVAHEFGHAYLDILRPDFWSTQSLEIWSFHEAFGDMTALLECLQYDELINRAIQETNGDLMKSNVLTKLAAEMGVGLYHLTQAKEGEPLNCLRDLSVVFNYTEPEKLPSSGPDNKLIGECHSFSRVFTGAFYEILVKISQKEMASGRNQIDAIKIARDGLARILLGATIGVPSTVRFFDAIARQMLMVDKSHDGKYQDIIQNVFSTRKILRATIKILNVQDFHEVRNNIKDTAYELQIHGNQKIIRTYSVEKMKLKDKLGSIVAQDNNPLFNLEIDVPSQMAYYFDENNQLTDIVQAQDTEIIEAVYKCLDFLNKNNLVGTHDTALFVDKKGKLIRKQIVCKCGKPNYCDPNAPEYGKPWKPANNSGCTKCHKNCLPRSCDCESITPATPPKRGCYTSMKSGSVKSYKVGQIFSRKVC